MNLAVVALLSLPFVFILLRRPVLRRLAVRNLARRPREALMVVVGSMFGTALITSSLVVGDTLDASIRGEAHTRLGPIDEVVALATPTDWAEAQTRLAGLDDDRVDGVLPMAGVDATVATVDASPPRAEPRGYLLSFDFAAARDFGGDPASTGISGPTPEPGRAVATVPLASALGLAAGDRVEVFVYGQSLTLTIDRVVARHGLAGFGGRGRNLLVAPGTIEQMAALMPPGAALPPEWMVAVSNRGGVEEGAPLTAEVEELLKARLGGLAADVRTLKRDVLDDAADVGAQFRQLFTAMGAFGVIAGILLLVNLFVMLAEERKSELGMLRAVGLRRSALVGAFATEGWLYALGAALTGAAVGVGMGFAITEVIAGIFSDGGRSGDGFSIRFDVEGASVAQGFATGFVIAVVTVVVTSVRISRLNVIRAIRDLPEPAVRHARARTLVAGAAAVVIGGLWAVTAAGSNQFLGILAGPVLALVGMVPLLSRVLPRRLVTNIVPLLVIAWALTAFRIEAEGDIEIFVAQGVILTGAAVAFVSQQHDRFGPLIDRLGGGVRTLSIRLGLAYPLARRFRTGLTLAMYSLVIFTLTFITVLNYLFTSQLDTFVERVAGGYDVLVTSSPTNPLTTEELETASGVASVAPLMRTFAQFDLDDGHNPRGWPLSGFDARLIEGGAPDLEDLGRYPTKEAAYQAVLDDPGLILVDSFFLQQGGGPPENVARVGQRLHVVNPQTGTIREVEVAGRLEGDFAFNGALYGLEWARSLFGERLAPGRAYVALSPGTDPASFASELAGRHIAQGVEADPIATLVEENFAQQRQIFRLFQGYLGVGLIVGIAGLGVVMVRAVRERTRQIGVLRSLGFQPGTVRRSFVIESGFVALEGTVIGVTLSLLTVYSIVANSDFFGDLAFTVPWLALAVLIGATVVASLVATAAPAQAAARIRPAVALRALD